ncbi:leucine-rich repeat-containing protein 57 [Hydra vulgaris]|uniref:Leucine-rich repeat-containing protein 57 n=1 Tax=Hydra vulgaris TaxID=6087 RepID=A0ABM4C4J9_HYDVU
MGNSISPHIENARKTGICSLKDMKLKELPLEITKLPSSLRTLDLSHNQLKALGPLIGQFTSLKSLSVNHNQLKKLPLELNGFLKLENLSLSANILNTFTLSSASKMNNLKTININNNKLKEFPECLCLLPNIDVVDISNNFISSLPTNIGNLKAIELNLNKNKLNCLSDELTKCERLKVLRVEENCLGVDAFTENILKNSKFSVLAFEGNLFTMKQLQEMNGYDEYIARYSAGKKKL